MKKVKRTAALIAAAMLAVMITGCSSKCKESGCDQDATKDGYCDISTMLHTLSATQLEIFSDNQ